MKYLYLIVKNKRRTMRIRNILNNKSSKSYLELFIQFGKKVLIKWLLSLRIISILEDRYFS